MRLCRLNIGQNHKISLDAAQNAVLVHLYNAGNIGSLVLKIFTVRPIRCDAMWPSFTLISGKIRGTKGVTNIKVAFLLLKWL